jgi:transcriptional regulator with XRE-family HTH domain
MSLERIGQNIQAARRAKGWRQKDLAAALNVTHMTVSRWERGTVATLSVRRLQEIADTLEVPLAELVGLDNPKGAA